MFDGTINEHALCFRHVKVEFCQEQVSAAAAADPGLCKLIYHCACFHLL
jgi:hypothetical protein